jgi:hypothetical protein
MWMILAAAAALVAGVVLLDRWVNGAWVWWSLRDWWRTR